MAAASGFVIARGHGYGVAMLNQRHVNGPYGPSTIDLAVLTGGFDHLTDGRLVTRHERLPSGAWLFITAVGHGPRTENELAQIVASLTHR